MADSVDPPPSARTTILASFLRSRPRQTSHSHIDPILTTTTTTTLPTAASNPRRRSIAPLPANMNTNLSSMLRRRRSAGNIIASPPATAAAPPIASSATAAAALSYNNNTPHPPVSAGTGPSHRIRLVPHLDSRRSLRFEPISRDLKEGDPALRVGRFTDRSGLGLAAVNALNTSKLAFRSKVVSRAHAEIWVESGGRFFIRDTKSSSGTFLNHVRLSLANTESRSFSIKDGDIVQLGVDYQGGTEDIYKSVKIRVEIGREWQAAANAFNTTALKNLRSLALPALKGKQPVSTKLTKSQIPDCCICLFSVTIRQALFIAPCSHAFHFKCIRPLLDAHHPAFSCPICRTFADLEEDVEVELEVDDDKEVEVAVGELGIGDDGDLSQVVSPLGENAPLSALTTAEPVVVAGGGGGMVPDEQDDMEIDGSPHIPQQQQQHYHWHQQQHRAVHSMHSAFPLDIRGDSALGGAETEVEGDGNPSFGLATGAGRSRGRRARGAAGAVASSSAGAAGTRSGAASPLPLTLDETTDEMEAEAMAAAEAEAEAEEGGVDEELGMMAIDTHAHGRGHGHGAVLETNPFADVLDVTIGVGAKRKR